MIVNEVVRKIGFTGSTAVGKMLMAGAAQTVKVSLLSDQDSTPPVPPAPFTPTTSSSLSASAWSWAVTLPSSCLATRIWSWQQGVRCCRGSGMQDRWETVWPWDKRDV